MIERLTINKYYNFSTNNQSHKKHEGLAIKREILIKL